MDVSNKMAAIKFHQCFAVAHFDRLFNQSQAFNRKHPIAS
jgi:hypothetical protein